jgi:hypothetical protein
VDDERWEALVRRERCCSPRRSVDDARPEREQQEEQPADERVPGDGEEDDPAPRRSRGSAKERSAVSVGDRLEAPGIPDEWREDIRRKLAWSDGLAARTSSASAPSTIDETRLLYVLALVPRAVSRAELQQAFAGEAVEDRLARQVDLQRPADLMVVKVPADSRSRSAWPKSRTRCSSSRRRYASLCTPPRGSLSRSSACVSPCCLFARCFSARRRQRPIMRCVLPAARG